MENFHIRKQLKRNRGNQFYRNANPAARDNGTYCGAGVTAYDISWKDSSADFNGRKCCPACKEARKNDPKFTRFLTT